MRIFLRVVLALVLIGALFGFGTYVYNVGVTQGLAASGKLRCARRRADWRRRTVSVLRAVLSAVGVWLRPLRADLPAAVLLPDLRRDSRPVFRGLATRPMESWPVEPG